MKVADVARAVEALAPLELAADWDNVGMLVGDLAAEVRKVLVCTDVTEAVLDEAIKAQAQMIVAHHPVIFRSAQRVTACDTPVVHKAVGRGLCIYSAHTNLDAAPGGTSDVLADILGLVDRRPLEPIAQQCECKVVVFVPPDDLSGVASAAFAAGAGRIGGYHECVFFCHGIGSFCGADGTDPAVGEAGRHEVTEELRLEMICPRSKAAHVAAAVRSVHSYEEPAIDTYVLEKFAVGAGWGRIGKLKRPVTVQTLVNRLKKATGLRKVLLATPGGEESDGKGVLVTTAACFSGSAGSYFRKAIAQGATFFVTGEMGYHDAMDAVASGTTVACLGHGHSERLAMAKLGERLAKKLPKLKVAPARSDRDPFAIV